jgi:hypothetical protein
MTYFGIFPYPITSYQLLFSRTWQPNIRYFLPVPDSLNPLLPSRTWQPDIRYFLPVPDSLNLLLPSRIWQPDIHCFFPVPDSLISVASFRYLTAWYPLLLSRTWQPNMLGFLPVLDGMSSVLQSEERGLWKGWAYRYWRMWKVTKSLERTNYGGYKVSMECGQEINCRCVAMRRQVATMNGEIQCFRYNFLISFLSRRLQIRTIIICRHPRRYILYLGSESNKP